MADASTRIHGNKNKEGYTNADRMDDLADAVPILIEATRRKKYFNETPLHLILAYMYSLPLKRMGFVNGNYNYSSMKAMQNILQLHTVEFTNNGIRCDSFHSIYYRLYWTDPA